MTANNVLLEPLTQALKADNEIAISEAAHDICGHGLQLQRSLKHLIELFRTAGKSHILLNSLLSPTSSALESLEMAVRVARLAHELGRVRDFEQRVDCLTKSGGYARFRQADTLGAITPHPSLRATLRTLKFGGIEDYQRIDRFFSNARRLAPRIILHAKMTDYLFKQSRAGLGSRAEWDARLQSAFAIQHLLRDAGFSDKQLNQLIDEKAKDAAVKQLGENRGALVVISHAGFSRIRTNLFRTNVDNLVLMANTAAHRRQELADRIPVNVDARASLFAGLKALLAKKVVLLAPDGLQGSQNVTISVLGKETSIGDGAAFLAYESKCDIFWLAMTSDGNYFIPEMVAGPRRKEAESFSDFQMRFARFYEKMLNDSFSGDPGNLVPAPRWAKVFAVP